MMERMSDEVFDAFGKAWSGDKKVFDAVYAEAKHLRESEKRLELILTAERDDHATIMGDLEAEIAELKAEIDKCKGSAYYGR